MAAPGPGPGWLLQAAPQPQPVVDGGFVAWLRGEFAAANAIIDLLLAHIRETAAAAEFDPVAAAIQRRRHHWSPVVHLQHYFPVSEVAIALQHASAARQRGEPHPPLPPPRRHGANATSSCSAGAEGDSAASGSGAVTVKEVEKLAQPSQNSQLDSHISHSTQAQPQKEGLKLYKGLVDVTEIGKIVCFANEAKNMRREAGLEGQTFVVAKRPMKGHGREIIQLGLPITVGPPEDEHLRDVKVDPIPVVLKDLFDRLVHQKVVPSSPDYCVIDFFGEGDYSHPHHHPPWYGRPIFTLCLTDCDMVFGHVISGDSRGDHVGPLKLSLTTGSVLVSEGKSADIAKRALPATSKQRVLLSFGKSVSRKHVQSESSLLISPPLTPPPMSWGAPLRPGNIAIHPSSPKQLLYSPSNRVPAVSTLGLHHIPSNGIQTVFVAPAPVTPKAVPFATGVTLPSTTVTWMAEAAPRPASPRLPFQGTGVFLPHGSGNPPPAQKLGVKHADAKPFFPQESSASSSGVSARLHKANGSVSSKPTRKDDTADPKPKCNGSSDDKATGGMEERNIVSK
uniref:Fe2OG dioxygenase domain-containing protein n=1 Tax=Leersia perrieri TaxID=77586 RepID=A0A0D9XHE0_9ORYZ